jgi:hypothetical protein
MPDPENVLAFADADAFGAALALRHRPGNTWVAAADGQQPSVPARFWGYLVADAGMDARAVADQLPDGVVTDLRIDIWVDLGEGEAAGYRDANGDPMTAGETLLCSVAWRHDEPALGRELRAAFRAGIAVVAEDEEAARLLAATLAAVQAQLPEAERGLVALQRDVTEADGAVDADVFQQRAEHFEAHLFVEVEPAIGGFHFLRHGPVGLFELISAPAAAFAADVEGHLLEGHVAASVAFGVIDHGALSWRALSIVARSAEVRLAGVPIGPRDGSIAGPRANTHHSRHGARA